MYFTTNTASWRLPSQGELIKRSLKIRERIRLLTNFSPHILLVCGEVRDLQNGTTRLKRNHCLSFG